MREYMVTMERLGKPTNFFIIAEDEKKATDKAYELAVEYSHVIACKVLD